MNIIQREPWEQVALVLDRIVTNLEKSCSPMRDTESPLSLCFESTVVPTTSLYDYIARLHSYSECSDSCYTIAFIYIDRILQRNPNFTLNRRKIHRLVLAALIVAIKYNDDTYAKNSLYGRLGGVTMPEMNLLEISFLILLQFKVRIRPQCFYMCSQELIFQCQKVDEEAAVSQAKMVDCAELCGNMVKPILSTSTIRTIHSMNDMVNIYDMVNS